MSSNPVVPTTPVETPDPFKGGQPTFVEYSDYRKTGELPERFKEQDEAPKPPAADKPAETVEGKEPSETEQEKQERERDEAGKFTKKAEFNADQQKVLNREIAKAKNAERAKARAEIQAEFEQRYAAKTSDTPKGTPPVQEAAAAPDTNEPMPPDIPNLNAWTGTIEEYDAAVKQYPAKLKAFMNAQRQHEQSTQALTQRLATSEAQVMKKYPDAEQEIKDLYADIQGGAEPMLGPGALQLLKERSANPYELTYQLAKNREDLRRLAAINNREDFLVELVRLDTKIQLGKSATPVHDPKPAKDPKPKPPEPVGARATSSAFDVNDESLDADTWAARRNEQLAKKR